MFPTVDAEDISQVTSLQSNPSLSRDEQESHENSQIEKQHTNREITLNMLIKELVFCIALALTTYGALHNTPTKVSKHPQALRFFSPESPVVDWYRGQLSNALAEINIADISFVMYYAPWDAESQYVRDEFAKAAKILSDRVHFSAINCWNPGSECRLQHNKIPSWPILMAYTVTSRGILYKGPRDAQTIVNFLELLMKPLERISSTEDLVNLLSICDAVAVGYTPISDTSKYYNVWYHVALKTREFDTIGEICFASVTSEELAMDLGVDILPNARLMLWNDTMEYIVREGDHYHMWNETALTHWVLENFSQPVARIIPLWKKAFNFERYADGNPMLILFTPLNPLYEQLPSYALMREVAMEYYNCKNNESGQWTSELIKLQQIQRLLYQQKNFTKFCQEFKFKKPSITHRFYKKEVVSQNNKYPWNNTTQRNQKNGVFGFLLKRGLAISKIMESAAENSELLSSLGLLQECSTKVLPAERSFYDNYEQCQSYEESVSNANEFEVDNGDTETSMLPLEDDPLSPENLIQTNVKHFCNLMRFANEWSPPVGPVKVPNTDEKRNITHIHGLACSSNFTMHILAIDSVRNHHFAESLGIDITKKKDMTTVIILDSKNEGQYILSEEYNAKSLRDFIYNFTQKSLKRSLRTHVADASHTHYFGSEGKTEQMGIDENGIEVINLTTRTFRKIVKTSGMVTIVAVCGGMCSALTSRAVSEAARLLSSCDVRAQAARLDALRHDLPWHYTVHTYPTIFVFPEGGGQAESRTFPVGTRITSSGVVALALRALGAKHHLRVRLALCAKAQANSEKKTCLRDMREHITTVIGRNLKYWRRSEDRELKDALFKRLQHLHQVSLDLSLIHISDLNKNSDKQKSLLNSLSTLCKNWDIDVSILKRNITQTPRWRS